VAVLVLVDTLHGLHGSHIDCPAGPPLQLANA
jgi:hypothetical protein